MKIGIIGGGPAGMFAAIEASKIKREITLFDNNPTLGRKLAVTGAGRCNLTNKNISPEAYSSVNNFAFKSIIQQFNYEFLCKTFESLGIYTYHTDDGWVYPISNSAKNISSLLENHIQNLGVKIQHNAFVEKISKVQNQFILTLNSGEEKIFDKVIITTGGKAYPQLNASNRIIDSIEKLGHKIIISHPALAPIITTKNETKALSGVRQDSTIRIYHQNELLGSEFGNIIFTDWGINGPGVMNLSHLVHQYPGDLIVEIDYKNLLPDNFIENTIKNQHQIKFLSSPFLSILNKKIIDAIFQKHKLSINVQFSDKVLNKVINDLKFTEKINGTRGFDFSQISTGGIDSSQIDIDTLESKLCPGLYFAGEILDVMGPCGGYNLHWAFVSGLLAGKLL
jgi:predicted Rossmann fold flavoprotein